MQPRAVDTDPGWGLSETPHSTAEGTWRSREWEAGEKGGGLSVSSADLEVQGTHLDGRGKQSWKKHSWTVGEGPDLEPSLWEITMLGR